MSIRIRIQDIETQNLEWFGELASPRNPANYIVMNGLRDIDYDGSTFTYYAREEERFTNVEDYRANFKLNLDDVDILVHHNAPYEMMWWFQNHREEFFAFLKRGGRVFDTAYAEYLLTDQQSQYPSLNETAPLYGGTHKVDAVHAMWEAGYLTSDIDPELLSEYLSGPSGDIENTTKIFVGQWNKLKAQGMLPMALTRMEGLLMWSAMMGNGLNIDKEVAERNKAELEGKIAALADTIRGLLPADMPEEARKQFKFSSQYHMSAFVFGGVMKYTTRVPRTDKEGNFICVKEEAPVFIAGTGKTAETYVLAKEFCEFDEESHLWYDPARKVHQARYIRGKQAGAPKFDKVDTGVRDEKWGTALVTLPGLLRDKDRRNKEIADNLMYGPGVRRPGEWVGKRKLDDGTPVFSTAGEVLDILAARKIPGVVEIAERAKYQKDLGTYYLSEKLDDDGEPTGKVSGMLQFVQPDGIVHHMLNTTGTETTRLTSSRPNMQNLPKGRTSNVKQMFTSRFNNGRIVEADYKSLETMGQCCFTKDRNLTRFLLESIDMHCMRIAHWRHEQYNDVLHSYEDKVDPRHEQYEKLRDEIKPKSFAYAYGATARGIAYSTGCDEDEAQQFIDNEKELFPEVEAWYDDIVYPEVEKTGQRNVHKEQTPDMRWQIYHRGHWRSPAGTRYSFRQYEKWNSAYRSYLMMYRPTQMRNYPIQGETAFWVQGIGGLVFRWLLQNDFFGGRVCPINAVHDALYFDVAEDCPQEFFVGLKAIMECIPEYFNHVWPEYKLHVPFPVAIKAGPSMFDEDAVEIDAQEVADFKAAYLAAKGIKNELYPFTVGEAA